jgi:hypothetical protein
MGGGSLYLALIPRDTKFITSVLRSTVFAEFLPFLLGNSPSRLTEE